MKKKLLKIEVHKQSKKRILEQIEEYIKHPDGFFHIVSLNPENLVIAQKNTLFRKVLNMAQTKIIDGIGVAMAGRLLGIEVGHRFSGVDLMEELIEEANVRSLRIMLIGGNEKLAEELADCYNQTHAQAKFIGLQGIKNIKKPKKSEEKRVFSIVSDMRPHIIFVAFGSPYQELWLWKNRRKLQGIVGMGVGGGFDFLSGAVRRAPRFIRQMGLEWFYRLVRQPWRLRRQTRLVEFVWLVAKQQIKEF